MSWKENAIMFWSTDGWTWDKITDHNRQPLSINFERFGTDSRMVDATMRRYTVAKKRTFQVSWQMLPSKVESTKNGRAGLSTVDGGWAGEDIESFYNRVDGAFKIKLRKGTDENKDIEDNTIEIVDVMITEFSKTIEKRGAVDLWSLEITLVEV